MASWGYIAGDDRFFFSKCFGCLVADTLQEEIRKSHQGHRTVQVTRGSGCDSGEKGGHVGHISEVPTAGLVFLDGWDEGIGKFRRTKVFVRASVWPSTPMRNGELKVGNFRV